MAELHMHTYGGVHDACFATKMMLFMSCAVSRLGQGALCAVEMFLLRLHCDFVRRFAMSGQLSKRPE